MVRNQIGRMEQVIEYRTRMVKYKVRYVLALTAVVIVGGLCLGLIKQVSELRAINKELIEANNAYSLTVSELEEDKEELNNEIVELKSIDRTKDIESIVEGTMLYKGYGTDVKFIDYILDDSTGERIRTFKNTTDTIVVYLPNTSKVEELEKGLGNEYNLGTERYVDVVNNIQDSKLLAHTSI